MVVAVVGSVLFSGGGGGNLGSISTHTETQRHQLPPSLGNKKQTKSGSVLSLPSSASPACPEEGEDRGWQRGWEEMVTGAARWTGMGQAEASGVSENRRKEKRRIRKSTERFRTPLSRFLLCLFGFPFSSCSSSFRIFSLRSSHHC